MSVAAANLLCERGMVVEAAICMMISGQTLDPYP